jgi:hypothetical protein
MCSDQSVSYSYLVVHVQIFESIAPVVTKRALLTDEADDDDDDGRRMPCWGVRGSIISHVVSLV